MNAEQLGNIKLYNADCMEIMKGFNDKQFDLAICDPPYGINFSSYERGGSGVKTQKRYTEGGKKEWDNQIPSDDYFKELYRISHNQIVWGGNYFPYLWQNGCKGFIFWYKHQPVNNFAKGELAWTSFDRPANYISYMYYGNINSDKVRISPTQKPIQLYKWLLQNYAKQGDTILDTHFGSLSIGIACHDMGFELTAIELDKDYYEAGKKRLMEHQRQLTIF